MRNAREVVRTTLQTRGFIVFTISYCGLVNAHAIINDFNIWKWTILLGFDIFAEKPFVKAVRQVFSF